MNRPDNIIELDPAHALAFARTNGSASTHPLSVCVVYQDAFTHDWADEICGRVGKIVGHDALRITWWRLGEMSEPAVLAGAVSTALRADVLVIAVHATDGFPLPFYVWVHSWVPHRSAGTAALVALIALPKKSDQKAERAREYFRSLAAEARLDFLLQERKVVGQAEARAVLDLASCPESYIETPGTAALKRKWRARVRQTKRLAAA